jgi:hypothetical protein
MYVLIPFRPGLAVVSMNCSREDFQADVVAGITVGIMALSLAMEHVNRVLNFPVISFPAVHHNRWLPEPDKIDTVGGVKRSALDYRNPISKSRVPAVGTPSSGAVRKEIPQQHAVLPLSPGFGAPREAGAPGIAEPFGR